jgi:hypothetical protein
MHKLHGGARGNNVWHGAIFPKRDDSLHASMKTNWDTCSVVFPMQIQSSRTTRLSGRRHG